MMVSASYADLYGALNMNKTSENQEYERFDNTMQKLMKVPHSKVRAKLEAEKAGEVLEGAGRIRDFFIQP